MRGPRVPLARVREPVLTTEFTVRWMVATVVPPFLPGGQVWGRRHDPVPRRLATASLAQAGRSVLVRALVFGRVQTGLGAGLGALVIPEVRRACRTPGIGLRPVELKALAAAASLGPQVLAPCPTGHQRPRFRASSLRSRAICSGSVRLRSSPMLPSTKTWWR